MKVLPEWATLSLLYMYVAHIQPEQVGEARKLVIPSSLAYGMSSVFQT